MPWKAQTCPFCSKKYANKKGLQSHLVKYTGEWRYPADGVHDVLEIKKLAIMNPYFRDEKAASQGPHYKCPTCAKIFSGQRSFMDHVFYLQHYGDDEGGAIAKSLQSSSFDTEPYRVWQPQGSFPFLKLPLELRELVYKAVFCFERIEVCNSPHRHHVEPDNGVWPQHNPSNNLLAIMTTSRQVYYEARRIFYLYNRFVFHHKSVIPVFLIGIGKENALLLKSVEWARGDDGLFENHIEIVKSCIMQKGGQEQPQSEEIDCWNNAEQYLQMQQAITNSCRLLPWTSFERLQRLDADDVPTDFNYRYRYVLTTKYHDHGNIRHGEAGYELIRFKMSRPHSG